MVPVLKKTVTIESLSQLVPFARELAGHLEFPMVLGLSGELGAGKTTLTKALAKELGVRRTVNSPTFTILKSYTMENGLPLHHIDAYRLEGSDEELGLDECFESGLSVVEWYAFLPDFEDQDALLISISRGKGEEERIFEIEARGKKAERLLEEIC